MTYKILNLYACLGGNRYKWDEVANEAGVEIEVTAVEIDPELARLYKERFPYDLVIITDAHDFLLKNYKSYNMIWSSPPCPSHSKARFASNKIKNAIYPELTLYQEIIFLKHYFPGLFIVENVIPFYTPLIPGYKRGRHIFWSNFFIPYDLGERKTGIISQKNEVKKLCELHEYDFYRYKGLQRVDKIARNLVDFEVGKTILQLALNVAKKKTNKQMSIFDIIES